MKLLSFIGAIVVLASCSVKKNMHNIAYSKTNNSLLWEITGNGLKAPSYLYGTIHLISSKDFYLSEATKNALNSSELLVTEVDIQSLYNINPLKLMIANDSTIRDFMSEEDYTKIRQIYIDKMYMTGEVFDKTLSRMLPIMLQQQIALLAFGDNTKSYEMELVKLANKKKIENIGLETQDFQLDILTKTPIQEQVNMLIESVDSLDKGIDEMNKLLKLYKEERIDDLAEYINQSENSDFSNRKDDYLTNRNADWIPKIEILLKEKQCFIAVGAAHLPMKTGVIQLLKEKGYTVKALKN